MDCITNFLIFLFFLPIFGYLHCLLGQSMFIEAVPNMARNLSCKVIHGEIAKYFTWNDFEIHMVDIVVFQSNLNTSISCYSQSQAYAEAELRINIINSTNDTTLQRSQLNFSVEQSSNHSKYFLDFPEQFLDMEENTNLPFKMFIMISNNSQILFEGNLVRLGQLPKFANNAFDHSVISSLQNGTLWHFYKDYCNNGLVVIVPRNISGFKYGFPVGIAYVNNQLTLLRWDNVTSIDDLTHDYDVTYHNGFLIVKNRSQLYMVPNLSRNMNKESEIIKLNVASSLKLKDILSVTLSSDCLADIYVSWYDIAVLVRLMNSSMALALAKEPYDSWQICLLPYWMAQAKSFSGQIDIERRVLSMVVNIGEPFKTMVVGFKTSAKSNTLVLESMPFLMATQLSNPEMLFVSEIPAILIYDNVEVWLSTDAGHDFKRIYRTESDNNILSLEHLELSSTYVFIITMNHVIEYSASEFNMAAISIERDCIGRSHILTASFHKQSINLFCSNDLLQTYGRSHVLEFDVDALIVPSGFASVVNDFEVSIEMEYWKGIPQLRQMFDDVCNSNRFPNVHLCSSRVQDNNSLLMRRNIAMQKFMNCSFEFLQAQDSFYNIFTSDIQLGGTCSLWTPDTIGQTLILLDIKAYCWIYWLVDGENAMANCSKQEVIGRARLVRPMFIALIDSRGDATCEQKQLHLIATNESNIYEVKSGTFTQIINKMPSYIRMIDKVGRLIISQNSTYVILLEDSNNVANVINYTCLITKKKSQPRDARSACRFDVEFQGLPNMTIYLDANDQAGFNVTIIMTTGMNGVPFLDEKPPVAIQPIAPSYVNLQIKPYMKSTPMSIRAQLTQKPYDNGTTILSIYSTTQRASCKGSRSKLTIHGTCPPGKHLAFEYPLSFDTETWLYGNPIDNEDFARIATLPYNYQPPSHLGKAIPLTGNIYNADPSKPMHRGSYKISRDAAKYKQCYGKLSRLQCGCTLEMTISVQPSHSDCIQRTYKIFFVEEFIPQLLVINGDGTKSRLTFPYCITEINDRKDFTIMNKASDKCMSASKKSSLKFDGSGLFHFKVKANKSGNTFCDLETYFMLFVADAPMPHPAQDLVRAMTSFCFGSIILCTFLLHYHLK